MQLGRPTPDTYQEGGGGAQQPPSLLHSSQIFWTPSPIGGFKVRNRVAIYTSFSIMNIQVFIAGDHASSKERVADLIRGCGFTPVDKGALPAAREIEDIPGETTVIKMIFLYPKCQIISLILR